jgi:hypothetical protein
MVRVLNLIVFILVLLVMGFSACSAPAPQTKESKLKAKRDELVKWKEEVKKRDEPMSLQAIDILYNACRREEAEREESKDCGKQKEESLNGYYANLREAYDHINEIKREIKELEQSSDDTNQNQ